MCEVNWHILKTSASFKQSRLLAPCIQFFDTILRRYSFRMTTLLLFLQGGFSLLEGFVSQDDFLKFKAADEGRRWIHTRELGTYKQDVRDPPVAAVKAYIYAHVAVGRQLAEIIASCCAVRTTL